MHTFTASDGTVIIYNPDLSDVRINVNNDHIEDISYMSDLSSDDPQSQVHVSGPALREFIVDHLRKKMIDDLKNVDIIEFLKDL